VGPATSAAPGASAEPPIQGFGWAAGALGAAGLAGAGYGLYRLYRWLTRPAAGAGPVAAAAPPATAEERMKRWQERGEQRRQSGPVPKGRVDTPTGPGTLSGVNQQRIAQTRKADYQEQTHGRMPPYASVAQHLPSSALPSLLGGSAPANLTGKQASAATLGSLLAHASEEHAAPGAGKLQRAIVRRAVNEPGFQPYSAANNPAVPEGGHADQRALLAGEKPLSTSLRATVDRYASDSSDEEEKRYYPYRDPKPFWKKRD
jgi:hypothetical protein